MKMFPLQTGAGSRAPTEPILIGGHAAQQARIIVQTKRKCLFLILG